MVAAQKATWQASARLTAAAPPFSVLPAPSACAHKEASALFLTAALRRSAKEVFSAAASPPSRTVRDISPPRPAFRAPLRHDFFRRNGLPIRPGSAMQTAARARPLVARAPHAPALRPQSSFSHPLSPTPKSSSRLPHFRPSLRRPPGLPPPALPAPGSSCATFPSPSDRLFPKTKARPFMRNLPRGTGRTMSAGGSPGKDSPAHAGAGPASFPTCGRSSRDWCGASVRRERIRPR